MKIALLIALSVALPTLASAESMCSPLNHCQLKKISWQKNRWKTLASKEFKFEKFCDYERPQLELEKDLGIELWILPGSKGEVGFKAEPYVDVSLHTYKLTYVVAGASVPLGATGVAFSHRLKPNGKDIVQVSCDKQ